MCGRFTRNRETADLRKRFDLSQGKFKTFPRFNIAPGQDIPVVINRTTPELINMRWGLTPSWSKDPDRGFKPINARAETLDEKPMFKTLLQKKRCLIPADGFYEWRKEVKGAGKTPLYFYLKSKEFFSFAGLWDLWQGKEDKLLYTFTIITCEPNSLVGEIHNRMPVILNPQAERIWLDPTVNDPEVLKDLLKPYPSDKMSFHRVSNLVNNVKNDSMECLTPQRDQKSLF